MRVLTSPTGTRYTFDPGSPAVELLLSGGPGRYERWEVLHEPADLRTWLADSMLGGMAPLTDLRIRPAELARVKHVRDALWDVLVAVARGEEPVGSHIEILNQAAESPPRPRVDPDTGAREWVGPVTGTQVLGALARDALDILSTGRRSRIRECAAGDCHLVFEDTSRPGNRRWCSMQRCGNRNKINNFRAPAGPEIGQG
ncbi:ABATE domain-containing protein [Actinokineospora sp. NBRC 105648]|uniref:CGNR zinc finger domain-containing protein n=1 Tax=Actinokineospora sp. NBRC 105648 TaxID=3032206 RepID=UPI0024A42014|nr:ABATE domain-containing protein [Actinokineospora sp. NBRC 105648]GLZ37672.1 hypothetical protein Acsp05_12970 [Actinokineospora sp. NBRC 105648]